MITIQFQDVTGNWVTATTGVVNNPQIIMNRMRDVKMIYPDKRVRAIDNAGRIVDML